MSDIICDDQTNGVDYLADSIEQMNVSNGGDLPNVLIVTNVDEHVFQDDGLKVC